MSAIRKRSNGHEAAARAETVPRWLTKLARLRKRWEREAGDNIGQIMIPANLALLDVLDALEVHPSEYDEVLGETKPNEALMYLTRKK